MNLAKKNKFLSYSTNYKVSAICSSKTWIYYDILSFLQLLLKYVQRQHILFSIGCELCQLCCLQALPKTTHHLNSENPRHVSLHKNDYYYQPSVIKCWRHPSEAKAGFQEVAYLKMVTRLEDFLSTTPAIGEVRKFSEDLVTCTTKRFQILD